MVGPVLEYAVTDTEYLNPMEVPQSEKIYSEGYGLKAGYFFGKKNSSLYPYIELSYLLDATNGSRIVVRHNSMYKRGIMTHGYHDSAISYRGPLSFELYSNTFECPGENCTHGWVTDRGGTWIVTNNTVTANNGGSWGWNNTWGLVFEYYHLCRNRCNSSVNHWAGDVSCMAYPCPDQPGRVGTTYAPAYIWNNVFPTADFVSTYSSFPCDDAINIESSPLSTGNCNDGIDVEAGYIRENRDYFLSAHPSWTPYIYPHPLRQETAVIDTAPPKKPSGFRIRSR